MTNAEIEKRVEELLSQMTLEEKIGQMNQASMPPEEREDTKEPVSYTHLGTAS